GAPGLGPVKSVCTATHKTRTRTRGRHSTGFFLTRSHRTGYPGPAWNATSRNNEGVTMHRRDWLKQAAAGAAGLPPAAAKLPGLKITDVKTILTAPAGFRLVVVKVLTSEPGLYGLGSATFTQRARVVETAVDKYLRPFLLGKDPTQIEDIWQSSF